MGGGRKKKASKKKMKNGDDDDSNSNNLLHRTNNTSSTHSHGIAEYPNSLDERGTDSGEEEEIVDRKEVDVAELEVETLENGSGSAYLSAAMEDPPPTGEDDKEVAVVEESAITERGEFKEESIVDDGVPVKEVVDELAHQVVNSEELSQIKDASVEAMEPEQVQDLVEAVSMDDGSINSKSRGVVDDVKPLETDGAVAIPTSHVVDNRKELETHKPSEDQPLIGSNPLPVTRTSWAGCCGLFEVFSGGNR